MPGNREQLTEELAERLRTFAEYRDSAALLDAAVPVLTRNLAGTFPMGSRFPVTGDVAKAITVLVAVHWTRSQLLPDGQGEDDLQACLQWSRVLILVRPDLVPEPVRARLGQP